MTKSFGSPLFFFLFPLLLSFNSGGHLKLANGLEIQGAQNIWCVANPSASEVELKNNIEYACNNLGDCSMIQPGGSCFDPNTLLSHASVVMNQYFAHNGRNAWNCDFSGTGIMVLNNPSYGNCKFA